MATVTVRGSKINIDRLRYFLETTQSPDGRWSKPTTVAVGPNGQAFTQESIGGGFVVFRKPCNPAPTTQRRAAKVWLTQALEDGDWDGIGAVEVEIE